MSQLDRLSIAHVWRDHQILLRDRRNGKRDGAFIFITFALPLSAGLVVGGLRVRIGDPGAIIPGVSLLAGVLLAAAGQVIGLRARIADSVVLAGNARVRSIFREAISGTLLASLASLGAALALGALAQVPDSQSVTDSDRAAASIAGVALSAVSIALMTYLVMMLAATVRRLYLAYLEAFEGGLPLSRGLHDRGEKSAQSEPRRSEIEGVSDEVSPITLPDGRTIPPESSSNL